jgi:pyoverdine/dityrosine biosynthesis protein Dit1
MELTALHQDPALDQQLAMRILEVVFAHRRLLPGEHDKLYMPSAEAAPHMPKVLKAIKAGKTVRMVLPAFPAKSPSRKKTLSHLPDHGEELALRNLNNLCDRIGQIYEPGARIVICSDGRVFADVVRIPDPHVTEYNAALRQLAAARGLSNIEFFDLDDVFSGLKDYAILREDLMVLYGEATQPLRERCKTQPEAGEMYRGITRFLLEDFSGLDEFSHLSRSAIQNIARTSAYRVIQRSNAWGRLLADRLSDAVRLSIHPQFRLSEKIGINLIAQADGWATPWHSVVLESRDGVRLVSRTHAEKLNAALMYRDGRPSHYQLLEVA